MARSYISAATTEKERSTAMSALSSVQGLGFILGPGRNKVLHICYFLTNMHVTIATLNNYLTKLP